MTTVMAGLSAEQLARLDARRPEVDHTLVNEAVWHEAMTNAGYFPTERTKMVQALGRDKVGAIFEPKVWEYE